MRGVYRVERRRDEGLCWAVGEAIRKGGGIVIYRSVIEGIVGMGKAVLGAGGVCCRFVARSTSGRYY